MHVDEIQTTPELLRQLLTEQYPQWAGLPIKAVESVGTDHNIYRLGEDMAVRLPKIHWANKQSKLEHDWLPKLAPHLPLKIPEVLALGKPNQSYPYQWSVCRWLKGESAIGAEFANTAQVARQLAEFVLALQKISTTGAPQSGRGVPLITRDETVRHCIAALQDQIDAAAVTRAWEDALEAPSWQHPPVWIHGDLLAGNLLLQEKELIAIIDFGNLGLGDPAVDCITAWNLLDAKTRKVFRDVLQIDDATWLRGRGWAMSVALIAWPYYQHSSPAIARFSKRTIEEIIIDNQ